MLSREGLHAAAFPSLPDHLPGLQAQRQGRLLIWEARTRSQGFDLADDPGIEVHQPWAFTTVLRRRVVQRTSKFALTAQICRGCTTWDHLCTPYSPRGAAADREEAAIAAGCSGLQLQAGTGHWRQLFTVMMHGVAGHACWDLRLRR